MGQKISPKSMRISINKDWQSRWFSVKKYPEFLKEDVAIRAFFSKKLKNMSVDRVEIERSPDVLAIAIYTARPGLIIGRGGTGIEDLKLELIKIVKRKTAIRLDIQEFKNPETSATIVAEQIAEQIEKRLPYRRLLKQSLAKIMSNRDVKGAKVTFGGRLDGNDIARTEHLEQGSLPLQTLRAEIDYAKATAHTTYGTVGIKVWIYKGLKF
ncbi:MAG: 30S ribosomal protein S3 [Candidatus Yanofskybacteria bacterium RIFCSPHIGHO2_01_FULL_44_17]|uniref:Small ribosomal subunit protein uS3 n=1 Tax=Candidatus Yanofskybacteria bacterium RIFCSPHIGHO2_01_FULL_44_17 TaxID=1802668 RepID=A0A1F8ESN7_9BACT|nr:MAG: 30S ribosomal protein S3 [Candidatus Yanofskybacteria bacterium RIFCSPHIGHO2_01_FULL_44_17]